MPTSSSTDKRLPATRVHLALMGIWGLASLTMGCRDSPAGSKPLSSVHGKALGQKTERGCAPCHPPGSRDVLQKGCLSCHGELLPRSGLHRRAASSRLSCDGGDGLRCHGEHKPFAAPLVRAIRESGGTWRGEQDFRKDHGKWTGFSLTGGHARAACGTCHTEKSKTGARSYLLKETGCADCHQPPHGPMRPAAGSCARCHEPTRWRDTKALDFPHGEVTGFPLVGNHQLACTDRCHGKPPVFRAREVGAGKDPKDCAACHEKRGRHGGTFGAAACGTCHVPTGGWQSFYKAGEHEARTGFPLSGKHDQACQAACHKDGQPRPPQAQCSGCHPSAHAREPAVRRMACKGCHQPGVERMKQNAVGHGPASTFPLRGAHRRPSACKGCHPRRDLLGGTPTLCGDARCHLKDDIHKGRNGLNCADEKKCHGAPHRPEHGSFKIGLGPTPGR